MLFNYVVLEEIELSKDFNSTNIDYSSSLSDVWILTLIKLKSFMTSKNLRLKVYLKMGIF